MYAKDANRFKSEKSVTYYEQDLTSSVLKQQSFFVVSSGAIENEKLLNNILSGVANGGFLLSVERQFDLKHRYNEVEFIAKYTDGHNFYILFKKVLNFSNFHQYLMHIIYKIILMFIHFRLLLKYAVQLYFLLEHLHFHGSSL